MAFKSNFGEAITDWASGIKDSVSGFFNWMGDTFFGGSHGTNEANMSMNQENIAFQKEENEITRLREDNAIQRAASDMTAAGLSKTLAAGQPASAQNMTAPSNSYAMEKNVAGLNAMNMIKNLYFDSQANKRANEKNDAEVDLLKAQTFGQNLSNENFAENFQNEQLVKNSQAFLFNQEARYYNAHARVEEIVGENKQREIDTQIANLVQDRAESISRMAKNSEELTKLKWEITNEILKSEGISLDNKIKEEELKISLFKQVEMSIDISYAQQHGYPVGAFPSGLLGSAQNFGEFLGNNGGLAGLNKLLWQPLIGKDSQIYKFLFDPTARNAISDFNGKTAEWMENLGGNLLESLRTILNANPLTWLINR